MKRDLVSCGILRREVDSLIERKLVSVVRVSYLPAALHVDVGRLKTALEEALAANCDGAAPLLLYGRQCHPEMSSIAKQYGATMVAPGGCRDCIATLLGKERLAELDAEARTFYLTPGWLDNWEQIFKEGLGWDSVDARQNFGLYERILLLDTGVTAVDDERVLAFFDYTGIPVEVHWTTLDRLAALLNANGEQPPE